MLSVLRCLYQYCQPTPLTQQSSQSFRIAKNDFKIIYIAPMKALVAEIVEKMGSPLSWLGIKVRELTGDMQLTKAEIVVTQMIVTTPEKWDVVTHKSAGDTELVQVYSLLLLLLSLLRTRGVVKADRLIGCFCSTVESQAAHHRRSPPPTRRSRLGPRKHHRKDLAASGEQPVTDSYRRTVVDVAQFLRYIYPFIICSKSPSTAGHSHHLGVCARVQSQPVSRPLLF